MKSLSILVLSAVLATGCASFKTADRTAGIAGPVARPGQSTSPQIAANTTSQPTTVQPAERGFRFGWPKIRMPKVSMPRFPKFKAPDLAMPNIKLPFVNKEQKRRRLAVPGEGGGIGTPDKEGVYAIVEDDRTAFYELGPSQAGGADEYLDKGAAITLKSFDRSWAHVRLNDGRIGWVALDQVRYAGRNEIPAGYGTGTPDDAFDPGLAQFDDEALWDDPNYLPPTLPEDDLLGPDADVESLLDTAQSDPVLESDPTVEPDVEPVDSPEALFDPLLDPLSPLPANPALLPDPHPDDENAGTSGDDNP